MRDETVHYCHNILANTRFKAPIFDLTKDIIHHEMKQMVTKIKIKFLANNIISKTIEWFSLNNINNIFKENAIIPSL